METKIDKLKKKKKIILKKKAVDRNKSKGMKVSQQSNIVAFAIQVEMEEKKQAS